MKLILIVILILNSLFGFSQEKIIEPKFFFLGTLSDYSGRQKCKMKLDQVDNYYKYETSLLNFNYAFLKKEYVDLSIDSVENIIKSKALASEINNKFNYKFYDGFCSNEEDKNEELIDSLFIGTLKPEIFKTKMEKISYVVGVYTRYGESNKTSYCIRMANSISTFPICVKLLEQLGSKNIKTKIIESIPYNYLIYFDPNKELEEYLIKYFFLRQRLKDDENKMWNEMYKGYSEKK